LAWHLRVYQNKTGCGTQMTVPVCWRSRTHGDKSKEWEAITMKYAVLSGNERFEIREGELKSNGCAVLQVTHVGVCGTDTSYWHEGERYRGVVIGHEYSGVVVAPGTNRALKPGDRVAGYTQNVFQEPCGHCEACLAGDWDLCTNRRVFTWKGGELGHPGAYSQYTTWFPHSLVKLPDNVTNEEGAMAEPFAVGLHAIQVSQVKPNDRVLILGGGIIGMSCAEWARTFGASEITVSELNPQKREIIRGYQTIAKKGPESRFSLLNDFLLASNYAGLAFGTAGCAAVHATSYPLGGKYHVAHGESNYAMFTGVLKNYMELRRDGEIAVLNQYLADLLGCMTNVVYDELEKLLDQILPKRPLREYGVTREDLPVFAHSVVTEQGRLMANNFVPLDEARVLKIYTELF